ncbi:hypothetical protein GQ43DRAFT_242192 [Delitschia confertaspora ATCC 74209]|uniref:Uncharacterized protein n=1 Tax=Delitschia confertaspora ATCC 74209 TaxID=1513339 RepID=A0A9P4JRB5_9PLEO|nr:hypothetical protein GQ43DRAFT_242192 [Delitschia confertaspora ATCC 74209]
MRANRTELLSAADDTPSKAKVQPSLLWANQLKREHGYLLGRMDDLETMHGGYGGRIKAIEFMVNDTKLAIKDMKQMAVRIKAIEEDVEDAKGQMLSSATETQKNMMEHAGEIKKLRQKLSGLETRYGNIEEATERASYDYRSLMRKVQGLEDTMQKQGKSTEKLVKKDDVNNIKVVLMRLDAIESRMMRVDAFHSQKNETREDTQLLFSRITNLERAVQESNVKNRLIREEIARLNTLLGSDEVPVQPSSGNTTKRFRSSAEPEVLVPASPLPRPVDERHREHISDESPIVNAQLRKARSDTRALARPSQHDAQIVNSPVNSETQQGQTQKRPEAPQNKQPPPENRLSLANAGRKRKMAPPPERRETRSQAKLKRRKTESAAAEDTTVSHLTTPGAKPSSIHANSQLAESISLPKSHMPRRREKRQIHQTEDLPCTTTDNAVCHGITTTHTEVSDAMASQSQANVFKPRLEAHSPKAAESMPPPKGQARRKRKRREITQDEDFETFMLSAF